MDNKKTVVIKATLQALKWSHLRNNKSAMKNTVVRLQFTVSQMFIFFFLSFQPTS